MEFQLQWHLHNIKMSDVISIGIIYKNTTDTNCLAKRLP